MVWPDPPDLLSDDDQDCTPNTLQAVPFQLRAESHFNEKKHDAELDVFSRLNILRHTAIWCSIGTGTQSVNQILKMLRAGMSIARLSYSSGKYEWLVEVISNIRTAREIYSKEVSRYVPLAISTDDVGQTIQIGYFVKEPVYFPLGHKITLTSDGAFYFKGNKDKFYISYDTLHKEASVGMKIIIDFSEVIVKVINIIGANVICVVESSGYLTNRVKVHIAGLLLTLPKFSEYDHQAIDFAIREKLDIFCPSSVDCADDIKYLRKKFKAGGSPIVIVPKIHSIRGIQNADEIFAEADGIFIGRGYLGDDITLQKVFIAQRQLIAKSQIYGKPVCVLGQFLTNMVKYPDATMAENDDIANAAYDGASSIMTHNETTVGKYPEKVCRTLHKNLTAGSTCFWYRKRYRDLVKTVKEPTYATDALAMGVALTSYASLAAAIIVLTQSGKTASLIIKYFPRCPVIAVSRNLATVTKLCIYRGVCPLYYRKPYHENWKCDVEERIQFAIQFAKETSLAKAGDPVVIQYSFTQGSRISNALRIFYLTDVAENVTVGEEYYY